MKRFFAALCALLLMTSVASAETLSFYSCAEPDDFAANHPGVTIVHNSEKDPLYSTTSEYAGALLTRSFGWDIFVADTSRLHTTLLMEKGYLLDLSGSEAICEAMRRMHPYIQQRCMVDGKIYAVPLSVSVSYVPAIVEENWEAAGYTLEDVPQSFPDWLDFIECHLERRSADPSLETRVWNRFEQAEYDAHTYASMLVKYLVESHILQSQYSGEPVRFNTPEMIALLERTRDLGERIFSEEPTTGPGLFAQPYLSWDARETNAVGLRLSEEQPRLISASLNLYVVNAATQQPELAIEALEAYLAQAEDTRQVLFYADAQPIANELSASDRTNMNLVALAQHRLDGDDTPWIEYLDMTEDPDSNEDYAAFYGEMTAMLWDSSDQEVRDMLDKWQSLVSQRKPYRFSPEELAAYKLLAPTVYLQAPSVFSLSEEAGKNFTSLTRQFSDGIITAEQFVIETDRIAAMVEQENQ